MKKFMVLFMADQAVLEQMMKTPPEDMKGVMDEWMAWYKANEKALADVGAPLGKTKRLDAKGLADSKNGITGYSVVEGESFESAAKLFKDHPHLKMPGCTIDLLELRPMPAM
jgi:hypothetical protein